jgi:hypothetical protein
MRNDAVMTVMTAEEKDPQFPLTCLPPDYFPPEFDDSPSVWGRCEGYNVPLARHFFLYKHLGQWIGGGQPHWLAGCVMVVRGERVNFSHPSLFLLASHDHDRVQKKLHVELTQWEERMSDGFKRSNAQLITVHRDPVSRLEIDHLRPFSVTVR